jgi:serpin B
LCACRRIGAVVLACALAAGVASAGAGAAGAPSAAAADAENAFALSLLGQLGGSGNVVYSPYSVDTALTMVDAGAAGPTAAQISHVLGAASNAEATSNAAALRGVVQGAAAGAGTANAPTLELANALWTQRGVTLQTPFVATLTNAFGAPPQATDFRGAPQTARRTINSWVSGHTAGLIPNLLPQGSVSAATVFVLANAIYLKAHWASPFDVELTHAAPFTTASGASVSAQFMRANDTAYRYAAGVHFQAVDLPYQSSSLSLLAILPTGESLARFSSTFNAGALRSLVASLRLRRVNLRMPKIHLHTQTSLNASLEALGMRDAFGAAANFSGITTQAPLQISLVEHAADLKVDEQGTVAAAATGIVGPTAIAMPPGLPVTVNLDRPYLLLLREDSSGAILFVARVANPDAG